MFARRTNMARLLVIHWREAIKTRRPIGHGVLDKKRQRDVCDGKEVIHMMPPAKSAAVLEPIRPFVAAAAVLFVLTMSAMPAAAEDPQQKPAAEQIETDSGKGFYLGIRFIGSSLHVDETDEDVFFVKDDGGGVQFQTGYRFNRVFSLKLSFVGASHDTSDPKISAGFGLFQLFALYRFAPENPFRPYIKGGIGGYGLTLESGDLEAKAQGGGVAFGGGFDYFFSRHFSIGVDFTHNIIEYNEVEFKFGATTIGSEIDEEGAMSSLGLGLTYYF